MLLGDVVEHTLVFEDAVSPGGIDDVGTTEGWQMLNVSLVSLQKKTMLYVVKSAP